MSVLRGRPPLLLRTRDERRQKSPLGIAQISRITCQDHSPRLYPKTQMHHAATTFQTGSKNSEHSQSLVPSCRVTRGIRCGPHRRPPMTASSSRRSASPFSIFFWFVSSSHFRLPLRPLFLRIVPILFQVKKLFLTATFDGILPKETRQKAMHARGHFDNLYLVVDQQNRWKSELLPVPRVRSPRSAFDW